MVLGSLIEKLKQGLNKTRNFLTTKINELLRTKKIDEETLNQLEEILISADIGVETSFKIIEQLKQAYRVGKLTSPEQIYLYLKEELKKELSFSSKELDKVIKFAPQPPTVILVAGVNGTGKTTSIAKMGYLLRQQGKKVILAAGDTFRAAAIEQLAIWSNRIGAELIHHRAGADPGAVIFDAAEAAIARKADFLIVDTAGRLHTKTHLMKELGKINNILARKIPGAPHESLIVLDATTGQNAISQAKLFNEVINLTGIFLAKLDGTAKGGIVIAIRRQLNIPVKFIGIGEKLEDIEIFDPERFVEALFN